MSGTYESRYEHYRLAKSLEANGRYDEALVAYAKAIEVSSDYAHAWFYKSRLHQKLHQYKEAKCCAEKALELAPSWEKHIKAILSDCETKL
ncbi:MAG: tetratricopeptide repeat protein [Candidatus Thorarchaeota archaeon]|nr:tetratricopeptide repeat protein [Candidatus Thorarchaeota archaeon]